VKITDIIHSRRQPPNLKKLLRPNLLPMMKNQPSQNATIPDVEPVNIYKLEKCGKIFSVNNNMKCKSRNLITV
jgi:hypothetical protein